MTNDLNRFRSHPENANRIDAHSFSGEDQKSRVNEGCAPVRAGLSGGEDEFVNRRSWVQIPFLALVFGGSKKKDPNKDLNPGTSAVDLADRFWRKVDRSNKPGACWLWLGGSRGVGYGAFRVGRVVVDAHRLAFVLGGGELGPGQLVCHRCDVRLCCNPEHLFAGSPTDNVRDMIAKGRQSSSADRRKGALELRARRAIHGQKLSAEQAAEIRAAHAAGESRTSLAARFGVCTQAISKVVLGRTWADVPAQIGGAS